MLPSSLSFMAAKVPAQDKDTMQMPLFVYVCERTDQTKPNTDRYIN